MTPDQQAYLHTFSQNLQRAEQALAAFDAMPPNPRLSRASFETAVTIARQQQATAQNLVNQGLA